MLPDVLLVCTCRIGMIQNQSQTSAQAERVRVSEHFRLPSRIDPPMNSIDGGSLGLNHRTVAIDCLVNGKNHARETGA
jgi:hypothetical protein